MRTLSLLFLLSATAAAAERPNIVLIGAEDISPNLGCYGDPDAITPNIDKFATSGARFDLCFTHCPVCAPTRSGMITGQYPTTLGSHHMRSKLTKVPPMFTDYLRKVGYFTAWPGKTDFNFNEPKGWVDTTENWVQKPSILPKDKPFFAYINFTNTHESKARSTTKQHLANTANVTDAQRKDRSKLVVPPYWPDTPAVRECLAKYHENITELDYKVAEVLKVLEENGWADNTVVFFFGDHGWGLPRGKRWPYDSGTRIPFLVRWPGHIKPGTVRDDLTQVLDLAPTFLALAGVDKPEQMQGRVIVGDKTEQAPEYVFSGRDRMDEAPDRVRSMRSKRYRYIRNYHPEIPYAQYINYLDEMPIMQDWRRLAFAGKLTEVQMLFMQPTKPAIEFYDEENDPYEIHNLANDPNYQKLIQEHSAALDKWIKDTHDLGEVSEQTLIDRGIVKDLLNTTYADRENQHPDTPPVPGIKK